MDAQFKLPLAQNASAPERFFASGGATKKKSASKKTASKKTASTAKKTTTKKPTAAKKEEVGLFGKMVKAVGDVAKGAVKMGKKVGEKATGAVKGAVKAVGKVGEKAKKAVMPAKKKVAVKSKKSTKSKSMRGGKSSISESEIQLIKDILDPDFSVINRGDEIENKNSVYYCPKIISDSGFCLQLKYNPPTETIKDSEKPFYNFIDNIMNENSAENPISIYYGEKIDTSTLSLDRNKKILKMRYVYFLDNKSQILGKLNFGITN